MSKKTHPPATTPRSIAKAERRQWVRYPSDAEVTCRPFGKPGEESCPGILQDVSAVGAGVVCCTQFKPGILLEVRPLYRAWDFVGRLVMRVRKSTMVADGLWLLGCTFVRTLQDDELKGLL